MFKMQPTTVLKRQMSTVKRQDLPPKGGYAPIAFKRIPAKTFFNGFSLIGIYLGVTAVSLGLYACTYYVRNKEEIEMRSSRFALLPLLIAEKDRAFLSALRKNRDSENDLMKNVEGWETGTLYGERIYKTIPEDSIWEPTDSEYYAHATKSSWFKRYYAHHMS